MRYDAEGGPTFGSPSGSTKEIKICRSCHVLVLVSDKSTGNCHKELYLQVSAHS